MASRRTTRAGLALACAVGLPPASSAAAAPRAFWGLTARSGEVTLGAGARDGRVGSAPVSGRAPCRGQTVRHVSQFVFAPTSAGPSPRASAGRREFAAVVDESAQTEGGADVGVESAISGRHHGRGVAETWSGTFEASITMTDVEGAVKRCRVKALAWR